MAGTAHLFRKGNASLLMIHNSICKISTSLYDQVSLFPCSRDFLWIAVLFLLPVFEPFVVSLLASALPYELVIFLRWEWILCKHSSVNNPCDYFQDCSEWIRLRISTTLDSSTIWMASYKTQIKSDRQALFQTADFVRKANPFPTAVEVTSCTWIQQTKFSNFMWVHLPFQQPIPPKYSTSLLSTTGYSLIKEMILLPFLPPLHVPEWVLLATTEVHIVQLLTDAVINDIIHCLMIMSFLRN